MNYFRIEYQCGSYENGAWINTMSPIKVSNTAYLRPDGKVQTMIGSRWDYDNGRSDVVTIGVKSVQGYYLSHLALKFVF